MYDMYEWLQVSGYLVAREVVKRRTNSRWQQMLVLQTHETVQDCCLHDEDSIATGRTEV